jgi:signal transduction histidine kinase/TPR repeat protein
MICKLNQQPVLKKLLLLTLVPFMLIQAPKAQSVALRDSLLKKIKTLPNDSNLVIALNQLAFAYQLKRPDSTYLLGQQAYELSRNIHYPLGEASALNVMAASFTQMGDYPKALKMFNQSKKIYVEQKTTRGIIVILSNIADLYMQQGEWQNGLDKMKESYSIFEAMSKSDAILKSTLLSNIGECYYNLKQLDSAGVYLNNALQLAGLYNQGLISTVLYLLGDVALAKNNTAQAYSFYQQSIAGSSKEESYSEMFEGYYRMAKFYRNSARLDSTIYYAKLALNFAQKASYLKGILKASQNLSAIYEGVNDVEALRYFKVSQAARDSLFSQDKMKQLMSLSFEEKQKTQQIEVAKIEYKNSIRSNILIGILVVFGVLSTFLIRNNRQKQKANLLLQKQKNEIDSKAKELEVQKKNLEQSYNNIALLGEIGRKITASLSVETIIGTAYNNVNTLMDAQVFGIGIYHDDSRSLEFPATYENGKALPVYSNYINDGSRLSGKCFTSGKEIVIGDLHAEYSLYLKNIPTPSQGDQPVSLIYLPLTVNEKMLGVITVQSFSKNAFSAYHLYMLRTIAVYAAIALENADSFNKLTLTVDSLKQTQKQLIESEKMASLGELTAGIAHEIQNPLNFVNNFSEVNTELIEEMQQEIDKGNFAGAKEISNDIKENEKKINHHGKRAGDIVKGMLQHSRNSSAAAKELTDINKLADEYLRLAYHGLRAKDKSFNATMKTDFDQHIGNINIIPQDIGRVILNLITNAFYVVDEKKKSGIMSYEPTVFVSTKKVNNTIEISVKDNGNGIPQKVLDKIFQPFYTTKPTGKGTGLGLSLSYDIIKAHGGEIKVENKEQEGAAFIIILPV